MKLERTTADPDLATVAELSRALARARDTHAIARCLVDRAAALESVDFALLELVDEDRREARGVYGLADGEELDWVPDVRLDLEGEPSGAAAAVSARTPLVFEDAEASPHVSRRLVRQAGAKSLGFVPVVVDERVIGVLVVGTLTARHAFTPDELALLQTLAADAGLALERARSDVALAEALDRERVLARIARHLRSELDLDAVLRAATAETGIALDATRCFVRLGEPGGPMPVQAEWNARGVEPIGDAAERLPASNLAARERRTVAVEDVALAPEIDDPILGGRETLLEIGTRAVLATPVLVFDRMIGIFALHRAEPWTWSQSEIALAEAVAREAGLAIHTTRLLDENRERLAQQEALLKAAQAVTSELQLQTVLERLVAELAALLRADAADCYLLDAERGVLRCAAVYGLDPVLRGWEVPTDKGLPGQALRGSAAVLSAEYEHLRFEVMHAAYAGFARAVVAPMIWAGETLGVVGAGTRDERRSYDRRDAETVEIFASLAALALRNAESFEQSARQARIQRGFYRIAAVLGQPLSLEQTLAAIAQAAAEALGAAAAAVLLPRPDGVQLAGSFRLTDDLVGALTAGIPEGAEGLERAAQDGRMLAASRIEDDTRFGEGFRALVRDSGFASLLAAPLAVPRSATHALVLVLSDEPRELTDEDLELARQLVGAARGALERSELYEAERRAHATARQLARVGSRIVVELDPTVVVAEVVRQAPGLVEADAAAIWELAEDEFVLAAGAGDEAESAAGARLPATARPLGDAIQSGRAATASSVEAPDDPVLAAGLAASVAVPLLGPEGSAYGVLAVYSRQPRQWTDDYVQALEALAAGASAALSNASLYQRIALEKKRSDAILASIAEGIVAVDPAGRVVLWNAAAEQITDVPASEAIGRRPEDVLQRSLSSDGEEVPGRRLNRIVRGGEDVWLSVTEAVMRDPAGEVSGRVFAFRDVSSERVVEQLKSDFVASVSHELRAPLTSIYGFAETLLRREGLFAEEERRTFLRYISEEAERLSGVVERLLNVARLEAGDLEVALGPVDVPTALSEAVAQAERVDGAHGHHFHLEVPDEQLVAEADREKLLQVLGDLLDNAARYSPEGSSITVAARRADDAVEVAVADEGAGIAAGEQRLLFRKFYRGSDAAENRAAGPGLGLYIARGLVRAMGGRMWVSSAEGEGSSFVFELPAAEGR